MAGNRDLGKLRVDLILGTAEFEEGTKKAQASFNGLNKTISDFSKMAVAGIGAAGIGAAFTGAVSAANDLNAGMANIASLMPGNSQQVLKFRDAIQDLSITSGKSTKDLTDGMYQVVSAYGSGSDAVERLRIVTEASEAGLSTTSEALSLLSVTTKAYGDTSVDAMNKASDLAFKTVQLGQTTFPELASSLQNVASEASRVGVSQEELFASFAATTGVIGNASMVSTKMKGVLEALSKPTKDMAALYEQLGVESGQALIEQKGLQGALQTVVDTAQRSKMPLGNLIGSTEGMSFATSVAGAQADKYKESLNGMADAAGTTGKALAEQKEGINGLGVQLEQLRAAGVVALQKIGQAFIDYLGPTTSAIIKGLTEDLRSMADYFDKAKSENGAIAQGFLDEAEKLEGKLKTFEGYAARTNDILKDEGWGSIFSNKTNAAANLEKYNKEIEKTKKEIELNKTAMKDWYSSVNATGQALAVTTTETKKVVKETENLGVSLKSLSPEAKKVSDAMSSLAKKYTDTLNDIEQRKLEDAFNVALKNGDWKGLEVLSEQLKNKTRDGIRDGLDESIASSAEAQKIANNMADAIYGDKVKQAIAEQEKALLDSIKNEEQALEQTREKIRKIDEEIAKEREKQEKEIFDQRVEYASRAMDLMAEAIRTGDWEAAGKEAGIQIAEAAADAWLPGSGKLVRPTVNLADAIYGSIFKGGGNAETKARSAIESFLEDTLQANVIFGDGIQANWADAFASIAGEGETAFESLGTAIALLAGQTADMGGQIGFILAQNLNGNLDAARLLVQSLGIDAEAMGQALMDAALAGEMSWAEWAALQAEVNTLTDKGLVGAGDLTGAWNQFLMTGGEGQMALTALQSIAIEASEAGVSSLGQLQAMMKQLGYSQEEVDRFIATLQANGITNMQQLEDASSETLGKIVAGLENAGQEWGKFGEDIQSAIDQMSELEKKVRGIEDKEIDVKVNLKYSASGDIPGKATAQALGGIFEQAGKSAFALGGVVTRPTYFSFGGGFMNGLMGEAGPEAILPLKRDSRGRLGVINNGAGMSFNYAIDARGAGAGAEAVITQAIKAAHRAAVRDSVSAISEAMRRGAL